MKFLIHYSWACGEQTRYPGVTACLNVCDLAAAPEGTGLGPRPQHAAQSNWPGLPPGSRRSFWAGGQPGTRLAVVTVAATAAEAAALPLGESKGLRQPQEPGETSLPINSPEALVPAVFAQMLTAAFTLGQQLLVSGSKLRQSIIRSIHINI